jgi:hypothetical protein
MLARIAPGVGRMPVYSRFKLFLSFSFKSQLRHIPPFFGAIRSLFGAMLENPP